MVELINWGMFVIGMFSGIALTMLMYVIIWEQMKSDDKAINIRRKKK